MFIRKFYDAATAESAGAKYELLNEPISLEDIHKGFDDGQPEPEIKPEVHIEPEPKKEEPLETKEQVVETKEPAAQPVIQPTEDWREVLKKQDPKEIYQILNIDESALSLSKEVAQDEFVNKLITYRKEHGNLTPFIEAATKDWDKVTDIDLLRDELKRQHPTLSPEKFAKLAKAEVDNRFVLGEDADPDDAELASIRLETEANKIRTARKEEQTKFLDSVKPVDRTAEQTRIANEKAESDRKEFEGWKNSIESNPAMVKLMTDKKIVLGEKEKAFNYTVNPESIKEKTLNTPKFYDQFWTAGANGTSVFNVDKWNRVAAYADNPTAFEEALINHGMSLGTGNILEKELVNESPKSNQQSQAKSKSLAKTFVEEGQEISLEQLYAGG